jgi:outer membrane lipoprotein-sorting protein
MKALHQQENLRMKRSFLLAALLLTTLSWAQNATEIIRQSEKLMRGESSYAKVSIRTVRPNWERTMEARMWSKGIDKSLILITAPQREKGTVFLRSGDEVWNYVPAIKKLVMLPAAMVQSWMGTDFSNDALVNSGSFITDYNHRILGNSQVDGRPCYLIELTPKPETAVVWGKIITNITKTGYMQLKTEFYDEDDFLITTLESTDIRNFDGKEMPSRWIMTPAEEDGMFTEMIYKELDFNPNLSDQFFTKSNMKAVE